MNRLLITIFCIFCIRLTGLTQTPINQDLIAKANKISQNIMEWLTYESENIFWYVDYTCLDSKSNAITKKDFLKALTSGDFIPMRTGKNGTFEYILIPFTDVADNDVRNTIKATSRLSLKYTELEGTALPKFVLNDITGKEYTNQSLIGKSVVLNCWYIACSPCVKEIPDLNELAKRYKANHDLVFLAIGFDNKDQIAEFNKRRKFLYNLIYDGEEYLRYTLGIETYPTHIFINTNGTIQKIVPGDVKYIIPLLENLSK
jgi:peroxiredoxin